MPDEPSSKSIISIFDIDFFFLLCFLSLINTVEYKSLIPANKNFLPCCFMRLATLLFDQCG